MVNVREHYRQSPKSSLREQLAAAEEKISVMEYLLGLLSDEELRGLKLRKFEDYVEEYWSTYYYTGMISVIDGILRMRECKRKSREESKKTKREEDVRYEKLRRQKESIQNKLREQGQQSS